MCIRDSFSTEEAFAALDDQDRIHAWGNSDYGGSGAPGGTRFTIASLSFSDTVASDACPLPSLVRPWISPPPSLPPTPVESLLLATNTLCLRHFALTEHGGASGFDEASCLQATVDALHPAPDACFSLYPAVGACYVCQACAPTDALTGFELHSASWHYSPPPPPPPPSPSLPCLLYTSPSPRD